MHLKTIRAKRQLALTQDQRVQEAHLPTPREHAVEWLAAKIIDGKAGLDGFDRRILIVQAEDFERTWAFRALELVGKIDGVCEQADGGRRICAIVDGFARAALGLDADGAPVFPDRRASEWEPVAIAPRLEAVPDLAVTARDLVAPSIHALADPEPISVAAIRRAREAYDRQAIDRICPTCRGTGGGVWNDCPACSGNGVVA